MSKTVLFQIIQFGLCTQFSSIRPIDRTLLGATTPGRVDLGAMAVYSAFPKTPSLMETHYHIV